MKIKFILLLLFVCSVQSYAQYIGVLARYTETRLIDNPPHAQSRQNRLILSFFDVSATGIYTPVSLTNYDIWIRKEGLQYGSYIGGVLDSVGNNYPGYPMTAPKVVSMYNTMGLNYEFCVQDLTLSHYVVNGQELDCGFITVSHWETYEETSSELEIFTAPNVSLPYYPFPHPYYYIPGNLNFQEPIPASGPYNFVPFDCAGIQQYMRRGIIGEDTICGGPGQRLNCGVSLPVYFVNEEARKQAGNTIRVSWENLTESNVDFYVIERSPNGTQYDSAGAVSAAKNDGTKADYIYNDSPGNFSKMLYRIKAVEFGGQVFYSKVMAVVKNYNPGVGEQRFVQKLILFPNPLIQNDLKYKVSDLPAGRYQVEVFNGSGQVLLSRDIWHSGGELNSTVRILQLPRGIYQFSLKSANLSLSNKFIIKW